MLTLYTSTEVESRGPNRWAPMGGDFSVLPEVRVKVRVRVTVTARVKVRLQYLT
jgi:hypothetical protein